MAQKAAANFRASSCGRPARPLQCCHRAASENFARAVHLWAGLHAVPGLPAPPAAWAELALHTLLLALGMQDLMGQAIPHCHLVRYILQAIVRHQCSCSIIKSNHLSWSAMLCLAFPLNPTAWAELAFHKLLLAPGMRGLMGQAIPLHCLVRHVLHLCVRLQIAA